MVQKLPFLFEEYPALRENLPFISLIQKTPVQQLKAIEETLNCTSELWIKRDDQSTEIYGGNKPRKLEFLLADALARQKSHILTMGGLGSNHCLASTIFAKQLNLSPILILFDQPLTPDVQKKLLIFRSLDAEMLGPYGTISSLFQYLIVQRRRKDTYFLSAGGSSPLGVVGFVNAAFELKAQIENGEMPKPDHVFVTCGTLGTMAGLLLGFKLAQVDTNLIGVRVVQKIVSIYNWTFSFANAIRNLAKKTLNFLRTYDKSIPQLKFKEKPLVLDDYYGGGYGKVTPEGANAVELMKTYENIVLDTTYTGKTFAGLLDFIKRKELSDKIVLFWNTYNSRDIAGFLSPEVTYQDLPASFHKFFK
jgi:D-cysteine desulfhydrase